VTDASARPSIVIQITRDGMGHAEGELRLRLVDKYFQLLLDSDMLPSAICFYTEGVKLVCEGSPVLEPLRALSERGVHLIVCSTCLEYFGLKNRVRVGLVGGMPDIIDAQWRADKVITL
jgi:intracellular sulfur oxidation DsrE/DsrF family protein